jgi:hypothetical protein
MTVPVAAPACVVDLVAFVFLFRVADFRDLRMPGEVFTYIAEHLVLVLLPLLFVYQRRFNVCHPRILYMWAVLFLFHVDVLLPVSLYAGGNINYIVVPPRGILRWFEQHYRLAMGGFCILLTMAMRLGVSNLWMWLLARIRPQFAAISRPKSS